jgi:hypothetical protein
MNQTEAIQIGKEWLEHSPPFDGIYYGPDFMSGICGYVCRECCRRIIARGCDLKRIASTPIWEKTTETCALCEQTPETWEWHEATSESGDVDFWTSSRGRHSFNTPSVSMEDHMDDIADHEAQIVSRSMAMDAGMPEMEGMQL